MTKRILYEKEKLQIISPGYFSDISHREYAYFYCCLIIFCIIWFVFVKISNSEAVFFACRRQKKQVYCIKM